VDLTEKTLDMTHCVASLAEKVEAMDKRAAEERTKIAAAVPEAAAAVLGAGLVDRSEAGRLERALGDHRQALAFLAEVARHHAEAVGDLSKKAAEGKAGAAMGRPYRGDPQADGRRRVSTDAPSAELRPSDVEYFRRLGALGPGE
jgi:hypothetical protein